jgi:hypothetical protein
LIIRDLEEHPGLWKTHYNRLPPGRPIPLNFHRPFLVADLQQRAYAGDMISRLAALLTGAALLAGAQTWRGNHDESKVKPYTLPDPLTMSNGSKVRNAAEWNNRRRPEVEKLFESEVYGKTPTVRAKPSFELASIDRAALGGKAVRKQVTISFPEYPSSPKIHVLLYLPADRKGPVPVFLGLNFGGNHTVHSDAGIRSPEVWTREKGESSYSRRPAPETSRGRGATQWQVERVLARGYGIATTYYGDIEPDFVGGFDHSVRKMLLRGGQNEPDAGEWGAIGAWAWGLSRIADYLVGDKDVDAKRIAVMGHSRLGKTALWAGAQDTRFGIVISNNSGEGGAALSRRNFGEDVWRINDVFPHWFARNYRQYGNRVEELPVDQHMLIALIAPRPVYIASAEEDLHADPRGEFLAGVHAGPVYQLLGKQALGTSEMPSVHQPVMKTIGYHLRAGKHDVTDYDWDRFCDFADLHWRR